MSPGQHSLGCAKEKFRTFQAMRDRILLEIQHAKIPQGALDSFLDPVPDPCAKISKTELKKEAGSANPRFLDSGRTANSFLSRNHAKKESSRLCFEIHV